MKKFTAFLLLLAVLVPALSYEQFAQLVGPDAIGTSSTPSTCLMFDFAGGTIPGAVTFTGPALAAYYNSSGNLAFSSSNTARFDYDPVALTAKGWLYEPVLSRNALADSTANTSYTVGNATLTNNADIGPDGTTSAVSFIEDNTDNYHDFINATAIIKTAAIGYVNYTVFVKNKSGTRNVDFRIYDGSFANGTDVLVNPRTGAILATSLTGTYSNLATSTQTVGNGYFRITISVLTSNVGTIDISPILVNQSTLPLTSPYMGDGTSGIDIYGLDLDLSAHFLSNSYVATDGGARTRAADLATITVPTGCNSLMVTFDDGSTQSFIAPNGTFPLPPLNRPWITSIVGRPYSTPAVPAIARAAGFATATFYINSFTNLSMIDINSTGAPGYSLYTLQWPYAANPLIINTPASDYTIANNVLHMAGGFAGGGGTGGQDTISLVGYLGPIGPRFVGQFLRPGGYFEIVASFDTSIEQASLGSPAIWLDSIATQFMTYPSNTTDAATGEGCEIDFYEPLPTGTTGVVTPSGYTHDWLSQSVLNSTPSAVANWSITPDTSNHTFGVLWLTQAQNGGSGGTIKWYYDGVQVGVTMNYSAAGGTSPALTPSNPNGSLSICDSSWMDFQIHAASAVPMTVTSIHIFQ